MYIIHYFTLMYKFCTLFVHYLYTIEAYTLMYIGVHQEKDARVIGSKQAGSAPWKAGHVGKVGKCNFVP